MDIFLFSTSKEINLSRIDFDKKLIKKEKQKKEEKSSSMIFSNEGVLTNFNIFSEYVLIGFDNGKIMIYNRYKIQKQLSGKHSYHFPDCSDVLFYEMWFQGYDLYCLVFMVNEIRVYYLEYEKKETGELLIKGNLKTNNLLQKKLLNCVIDSVLIQNQDKNKIICLMADTGDQNSEEGFLKEIEYGISPITMVKVNLLGKQDYFSEFHNFKIFEIHKNFLIFLSNHGKNRFFKYCLHEKKNFIKEMTLKETSNLSNILDIFEVNDHFFCLIEGDLIKFLKFSSDFENNSVLFERKIKSNLKLYRFFISKKILIICTLLEDNQLILYRFQFNDKNIVFEGITEKKMDFQQYENLFLFKSIKNKLSILLTSFDTNSIIFSFDLIENKISDLSTNFLPEVQIFSFEILEFNSQRFVFASTYSSEIIILSEDSNSEFKTVKKWKFSTKCPYQLKKRNEKTLYCFSFNETYIIECSTNEEEIKIRSLKILFENDLNPIFHVHCKGTNYDIFVRGNLVTFNQIPAYPNSQIKFDNQNRLISFQKNFKQVQKKLIVHGSPFKKKNLQVESLNDKFKRLSYSDLHEVLLIASNYLILLVFDPMLHRVLKIFDLKYFLFKKNSGNFSLNMLKIIKFPDDKQELLCISSTERVSMEIEEEEEEKEIDEENYVCRLNFCELTINQNISLQEYPFELRFGSEQFIKENEEPIMDIVFLFDLEVFMIAVGGSLEVYSFEKINGEKLDLKFKLVLKEKVAKKIICLDSYGKDLILAGDYAKSVYVYKLEKTLSAVDKFIYKLNLLRTEKELRKLSTSKFINPDSFIGVDKYGECFVTKINNENYLDCNNNCSNFASVSLRDSSRNIHLSNQKFSFSKEFTLNNNFKKNEELHEIDDENKFIFVTTLQGSLIQIKFIDLIYLFDNTEINKFVESFCEFLKKQKSLRFSSNEQNCLNFSSYFKQSSRFLDMNFIEEFTDENKIVQKKLFDQFWKENNRNNDEINLEKVIIALKELQKNY